MNVKNKNRFYFVIILLFFNVINLYTVIVNRTVTTITAGYSPAFIAITPDGKTAYVANNNNLGVINGDTVTVINLETNTVITTISDVSFDEPYSVTINANGSKAYVTNSNSTTISIIDTATNTITGVITGFDGPSGMAITPDGSTAYVPNYRSFAGVGSGNGTTVRVVNLTTNTIVGPAITVDRAPASLAITPDGSSVYVICYVQGLMYDGTISIIQTSNNTVIGNIDGFFGPFNIIIRPDGQYAYVTNFGNNNFDPVGTTVSVVDLTKNVITKNFTVGTQPAGIALSPNSRFLYVTNYNTLYLGARFTNLTPGPGTVNIIDLCTNTVLNPALLVGSSPDSIAISLDGKYAYVTNYNSNNVTVLNIYDKMWLNNCNPCNR